MVNEKISSIQLFAMIVLFEFGTALVVPIGFVAEQDVWMSILLAMGGGLLLYLIYDYLYRQYPELTLAGYVRRILGNVVGWPVCLLYLGFFIYNDARVLRESGELLITAAYDKTPIFVIDVCVIAAVVYVLRHGVEVLARTAEIYFMIISFLGIGGTFLILISSIAHFPNLLPVLEKGWKPVLQSAFGNILLFPFGEMISFATILPSLNRVSAARRTGLLALLFCGVVLSFTHALEVAILGPNIYGRSTFPLFQAVSKINILDFIQRMDGLVILTTIITAFFKCAITAYAAMVVAADLFRVKKAETLALPVGMVLLFNSMLTSSTWAEFAMKGREVIMGKFLPFFAIVVPVVLLLVHWFRRLLAGPSAEEGSSGRAAGADDSFS